MAEFSGRVKPGYNGVTEKLQQLILDYANKPIAGGVSVQGHEHWWILEYGSGQYFTPPDGDLVPPPRARTGVRFSTMGRKVFGIRGGGFKNRAVRRKAASGRRVKKTHALLTNSGSFGNRKRGVTRGVHFSSPARAGTYEIRATKPRANGRPGLLAFYWKRMDVNMHVPAVNHPGVHPLGFIRRAKRKFESNVLRGLKAMARDEGIPEREDIVEMMNEHLWVLLRDIASATPVGDMYSRSDEGHLRDAWEVMLAE